MGIPEIVWELKKIPKYRKGMSLCCFPFDLYVRYLILSCLLNVIVSYHRSLFERYRCNRIYASEVDSDERELILAL